MMAGSTWPVGNDFEEPDFYYLGDGKGGFNLIERGDGLIPHSTQTTMSFDTADYDNDLDPRHVCRPGDSAGDRTIGRGTDAAPRSIL